jgi:hypothetical protein
MVIVGQEGMLLPRPLNAMRFKELHPVFTGEAGPRSIRAIQPALVHQDGSTWVLDSPGQVN